MEMLIVRGGQVAILNFHLFSLHKAERITFPRLYPTVLSTTSFNNSVCPFCMLVKRFFITLSNMTISFALSWNFVFELAGVGGSA